MPMPAPPAKPPPSTSSPTPSTSPLATARTTSIRVFNLLFAGHLLLQHIIATSGPSMLPTLSVNGDYVLLSRYHRRGRGVHVGDMVAFTHPLEPEAGALKRVVGMPGDFVCTGEKVGGGGERGMIQVPQGHCWLLGDNLPESRDSRVYGPLPLALISAKGVARVWPPAEMCWLRNTLQRPDEGW